MDVDIVIGVVSPSTSWTFVAFTVSDSVEAEGAHLIATGAGFEGEFRLIQNVGTQGALHDFLILIGVAIIRHLQNSEVRRTVESVEEREGLGKGSVQSVGRLSRAPTH